MCADDMKMPDGKGNQYVYKPALLLTNTDDSNPVE